MSWRVNPATGDYVMANGSPTDDPSLIYPAYYRLKVKRQQWLYAPDARYGSDFYTVKKRFTATDTNTLTDIGSKALQPIVDDGRADRVQMEYLAPKGRNDSQLQATLFDSQGEPQSLTLPVIGG